VPSESDNAPVDPRVDPKEKLWDDTYVSVLYPVWMEELVNAWLLAFWSRINFVGSLLVAVTSTGSAVAVWLQKFDQSWKAIALLASLSSILLTVATVAERDKNQGKFYSDFKQLRLNVVAFGQDIDSMDIGDIPEARKRFRELRDQGNKLIANAPPDIALTRGRKEKIQEELDTILRKEGYLV
jgi:hypothetical protein